jgi:hypothetical protein
VFQEGKEILHFVQDDEFEDSASVHDDTPISPRLRGEMGGDALMLEAAADGEDEERDENGGQGTL